MKKLLCILLLMGLVLGSCVTAHAAGGVPDESGFYGVELPAGFSITMYDEDDRAVAVDNSYDSPFYGFYANAVKFTVNYSTAEAGKYYAVILTEGGNNSLPTVDNIAYIDQSTADAGVSFNVYPYDLGSTDLTLWVTSNDGSSPITIPMKYYQAYILGDVDFDGRIRATDALLVLRYAVRTINLSPVQRLAADVDLSGSINASDALRILQYSAAIISSFN